MSNKPTHEEVNALNKVINSEEVVTIATMILDLCISFTRKAPVIDGLKMHVVTGIIGHALGSYFIEVHASNALGGDERELKNLVGDTLDMIMRSVTEHLARSKLN